MAVTQTNPHGNRGMAKPNGARQARAKSRREPFIQHAPPPMPVKSYVGRKDAWEPLEGSNPVSLIDLRDGCKWPVGSAGKLFCNAFRPDHGPYCQHHDALSKSTIKLERLR